ncbi:hypothetical protein [Synechococcus sp. 'PEA 65AY6A-5F PE A']|uniref:hypothetical protein n=1 Tax=Synechococcus sp. 'PEA 65AY6A-5F PE A' TaxID=1504259 RepID=UPI0039C0B359
MSHFVFAAGELAPLLRQQGRQFSTGYLHLHLKGGDPAEGTEPWVLTYYYGRLLFSADQPLNPQILLKRLSRFIPRLNLEWSQRAIRVLQERLIKDNSLPELLEAIAQLGLIKPGELEDALWLNLLTDFDRYLFERAGTCSFEVQERVAQEAPIGGFELEPLLQEAAPPPTIAGRSCGWPFPPCWRCRWSTGIGSTAIALPTNSGKSYTPSPKMASR